MASKFIVRAVGNGTKVDLAVSGRNAQVAMERAMKDRLARHCDVFIVRDRVTKFTLATGVRKNDCLVSNLFLG